MKHAFQHIHALQKQTLLTFILVIGLHMYVCWHFAFCILKENLTGDLLKQPLDKYIQKPKQCI